MFRPTTLLALLAFAFATTAEMDKLVTRSSSAKAPLYTNCKVKGTFAMTFDDGTDLYEKDISTTLKKANAVGTFFVNGNNWGCIYEQGHVNQLVAAYNAGHLICQHTWSHPDLTTLTRAQIEEEFTLTETAFKKILGIKPRCFRPPYGAYNNLVLEVAKKFGYYAVTWNIDTEDADNGGKNVTYAKQQYTNYLHKPGYPTPGMALNHSPYESTAHTVAPWAIKQLQAKGYKLVSVAECLGYPKSQWYQSVGKASKRDNTWTCAGTPEPGQG